ncbi:putative L-ascorbate peroxidase 6 isoform X2 [Citrus clementina]|uniref:putative L-ascorbate peroxidase 6 isoform X2 n=1 Tax=Citrus clementina TaxID=85681 RepID=UPI000CED3BDD|nr:putative L-ascorbate peroxidase 6 isoform X2 [Citrus x clementina]
MRSSTASSLCGCSTAYYSSPLLAPKFKFKFPAKSQRPSLSTVEFRANPLTISSSLVNHRGKDGSCNSNRRRRGLLLTATLPFLLPLHEFVQDLGAKAESGMSDYLLMKEEVTKVVSKGKAASVLRLAFHDAGTFEMDDNSGGMNGSIVYELERPENAGLKKPLKILEKAKGDVNAIRPVSWADMIALGGAVAVSVCGGPNIPVPMGRLDSIAQELVALSGAHTLGTKGFGNPIVFDNSYYKILLEKPWQSSAGMSSMIGLPSDRALVEDDECLRWIKMYADNQNMFFEDFKNAYVKLVNSGARWRSL